MYSRYLLIQSTYNRSPNAMAKEGPEGMPRDGNAQTGQRSAVHPNGQHTGWKRVVTRAERYRMYDGHCLMKDRGQVSIRVGFFEPSYYSRDPRHLY
jgi:hypothetical protein